MTLLLDLVNDDWIILAKGSHFDGVKSISVEIYFSRQEGQFYVDTLDSSSSNYSNNRVSSKHRRMQIDASFPNSRFSTRLSNEEILWIKFEISWGKVKGIQGLSWTLPNKKQENFLLSLLANKRQAIPPRATVSQRGKWSIVVHARRIFSCKNRCGGIGRSGSNRWESREIEKFVRCLVIKSRKFFLFELWKIRILVGQRIYRCTISRFLDFSTPISSGWLLYRANVNQYTWIYTGYVSCDMIKFRYSKILNYIQY